MLWILLAAQLSLPAPAGPLRLLFSPEDMPAYAQNAGINRIVLARMTFRPDRTIESCTAERSSGDRNLDAHTCAIILSRAKLGPGADRRIHADDENADPHQFKSGRDFAAWMGLTPKDHSTAGKTRLGGITRAGDELLRSTLVVGATAVIQHIQRTRGRNASPWLLKLLERKRPKLAAVALANKIARIAWKLMVSGERYRRPVQQAIAA